VQRAYPADGAADRLLIDARRSFVPDPESAKAMQIAARPALLAQMKGLNALESAPETAIEATAEERESAEIFHLEELAAHAPAPERLVSCDGYTRPAFIGDELGFYAWLDAHREALDDRDALDLEKFESDPSFQDLLSNHQRRARA
jgi:hypothetical protein